jgi:hypothetical protein
MKASDFNGWTSKIKKTEMPGDTICYMDSAVFSDVIIPLRNESGIPIRPSSLTRAHVRHEIGRGAHCTNNKSNLSSGTDWHTSSYTNLMSVINHLEQMESVGGIGIYFNTNSPMFHADLMSFRGSRLMWLVDTNGKYFYRENDRVLFYIKLGELLGKC